MKNFNQLRKRVLALAVALMMCLSTIHGAAFAAGECAPGKHNFVFKQDSYGLHWAECSACGRICHQIDAAGKHKDGRTDVSPTCDTPGSKTIDCRDCGTWTETIPALGHDWGEWTVSKQPTYTEAGEETRVCKRDASHTETRAIPAMTCDHTKGNHEDESRYVAPTCTEKGRQVYVCDTCNGVVENKELDPLGHDWGKGIVTKEPDCTQPGVMKYECQRTGCTESKEEEISAKGHTCGEFTWDDAQHWTKCAVCGVVIGEKKAHEWDAGTVVTEAGCTVPGEIKYNCTVPGCNASLAKEIPATGHKLETTIEAETCLTDGFVDVKCVNPGCDYHTRAEAQAYGHDWQAWETLADGTRQRICKNDPSHIETCDHSDAGHAGEWGAWTVSTPNSCEGAGERTRTCTHCGAVETEIIAAHGHDYQLSESVAPTAEEDGYDRYVCSHDPSHTYDVTRPATGNGGGNTPEPPVTPGIPSVPNLPGIPDFTGGGATPPAGGETDIGENDTPLDDGTEIADGETPLGVLGLNDTDHFAYLIGYGDGTIRPEARITRAEAATIFFRLMTEEYRQANWATENSFSDVAAGQWFNNAISTSANAGKLFGYGNGAFRPNDSITRAEFAVIAVRFMSEEVAGLGGGAFRDTEGHWAAKEIGQAAAAGWITGDSDGNFRPDDCITRAEAATIINNMLGRMPDKEHLLDDMAVWSDNPEDAWYYEAIQEATNSHDYDRDELGIMEMWTALEAAYDWLELENR